MLHKKFKSLVAATDTNIIALLDKIGVSNSSYYRFINGISDLRTESFVNILNELGVDVEKMISQKVNEQLGNSNFKKSLGDG
ncbi:MAG: helix-turn-helix transcriptional regulator [Bdellovibrionaceae bacterium]|nr:helix-turn-helix transcriptional regulator [Pseudobdellovibrionaceae bacterium]